MLDAPKSKPSARQSVHATVTYTATGGWCCSNCGGFVRQDAHQCKFCHCEFDRSHADSRGSAARPTPYRTVATLIGASVILALCSGIGLLIGAQFSSCSGFFPQLDCALRGGFIGLGFGSILALALISVS